jgi:hypothetical protein
MLQTENIRQKTDPPSLQEKRPMITIVVIVFEIQ